MTDTFLEFHDLLLLLQRRRRLVSLKRGVAGDEAGLGLSYVDESVLHLLLDGERNVRELSEAVTLERSWMSRVVQSLERKEYLKAIPDPSDGRSKRIQITARGKQVLRDLDELLTDIMDETVKPLSIDEQKKLSAMMKQFADALNAPPGRGRAGVHPVHLQAARLSRVMGIFGSSLLGTSITITQFHTIFELAKRGKDGALMAELDTVLPFDASTLSRTLTDFERLKWIERHETESDRRAQMVALTAKGREAYAKYRRQAHDSIKAALSAIPAAQLGKFIELLRKVTKNLPTVSSRGVRPVEARPLTPGQFVSRLKEWGAPFEPGETTGILGLFAGDDLVAAARYNRRSEREPYALEIFGMDFVPEELVVLLRELAVR